MEKSSISVGNRSIAEWFSSLPTLIILLLTIMLTSGEIIHSQLLKVGQATWDEYFLLRGAGVVPEPTCNPDPDMDAALDRARIRHAEEQASDPLAGMLGSDFNEASARRSLERQRTNCREAWQRYETVQENTTPGVIAFRNFEGGVAELTKMLSSNKRTLLVILLMICAATATLTRHHICIRPVSTYRDHFTSTTAQLIANSLLLISAIFYRSQHLNAIEEGVQVGHFYLHKYWIIGFSVLAAANIMQLIRPPKNLESGGGWGKALLTTPLYAFMGITVGVQFFMAGHVAGLSVYLGQIMGHADMFLKLGLYIWIGMMLRQTRLANLVFNVLRPWRMSPELMCFTVLAVAAVPTAYTGASGIFVIAAGATIYHELIRAGARKQLALATTAMSGSMGVVLRPCLLVVIIAALNNQVTTAEMFDSGVKVFILSLLLFLIVSQLARTQPAKIAPFSEAFPVSIRRFMLLFPYIIIMGTVVVVFRDLLNTPLNENFAPVILPVMMMSILLYEKTSPKLLHLFTLVLVPFLLYSFYNLIQLQGLLNAGNIPTGFTASSLSDHISGLLWRNVFFVVVLGLHYFLKVQHETDDGYRPDDTIGKNLESSLRFSTNETTGHIGALLMLMALSLCVGGLMERTGAMEALPETFPSIWIATGILVVVLVIIGMMIDPYGAVILINASIYPVAIANGLDPLHFWMITLVAIELGYLSPPVALNHLLTRAVVGDAEVESAKVHDGNFFRRYEKFILPIAVMLTALLMTAFLPLISGTYSNFFLSKVVFGG